MFVSRGFLTAGLAFISILLVRPALAVYTADWKGLAEDQSGKPVPDLKLTFGRMVDRTVTTNIFERWEKEKDSTLPSHAGLSYNFLDAITPKIAYNLNGSPTLRSQSGINQRLQDIGCLYDWYAWEEECPVCRFYNMVDDWYAGWISTAEFNALSSGLHNNWGPGPWDDSYEQISEDRFLRFLSSLFAPPRYFSGGVISRFDQTNFDNSYARTGQDGGFQSQIPISRTKMFINYGGYSTQKDIPLLEGYNYNYLPTFDVPRAVFSGYNADLTGPNAVKFDGWRESSYTKFSDYGISLRLNYGLRYEFPQFTPRTNFNIEYDTKFKAAITPNDPLFTSTGSWGQNYSDQWALHRVGFKPLEDPSSAWQLTTGTERGVVIAVIDSGIDLTHPDLHIDNIWINQKETAGNGIDDDKNGFIDDLIGWNFVQNNNNPFDLVGHGTHVAGLIAARWNNGRGIAGINRGAQIMVLKVLNEIGEGWGSDIARAIVYAVDNGAQIINISAEHEGRTKFLERAFAYAQDKGVLVVVSAGNSAKDTSTVEPANQPGALVVAATGPDDKRVGFSNWGQRVDLAAPGVDVVSLRARGTDLVRTMAIDSAKTKPGEDFVGQDQNYYRAAGTSFAAPIVSGTASLILAKNPGLTAEQVKRMLLMSADDIEAPGWDLLTGYGLLNARKALEADPNYYLYVELHGVAAAKDGNRIVLQVSGTVQGSDWGECHLEIGEGENPTRWRQAGNVVGGQIKDNVVGTLTQADFTSNGKWTVRLVATDKRGKTRESRTTLTLQ